MGKIIRRFLSLFFVRNSAAISIDSRKIRLVTISRNLSGFELDAFCSLELSSGFTNDPGSISRLLSKSGLARNRFGKADVIDLVCGPVLFNKIVDIPRMPRREAITALKYIEREAAPFSLPDAGADVWILGKGSVPGKMRVMLSALAKNELFKREERLKKSGLNFCGVSTATAGLSALIRNSRLLDTRSTVLFVRIGADYTGIHIFKDGVPIFTRETQIGSSHFAEAISQGSRLASSNPIALKQAESILREHGIPLSETWACPRLDAREMKEYISKPLDRLESEISRSIEFFRNTRDAPDIDKALLIGEGALFNNMDRYISETTGVDFIVYDPFDDFIKTDDQTRLSSNFYGPALAAIAGLSIDRGRTLNVANLENHRRAPMLAQKHPALTGLTALILAIVIVLSVWSNRVSKTDERILLLSQEVSSLKKKSFEYENLLTELAAVEKNNRDLKERIDAYPRLIGAGHDWSLIFQEIASSMPANSALTRFSIDFADNAGLSGSRRNQSPDGNRIKLEGIILGANPDRIAELTQIYYRLSSSSIFNSVSIGKTVLTVNKNKDIEMLKFEIGADLPPGSSKLASPSSVNGNKGS